MYTNVVVAKKNLGKVAILGLFYFPITLGIALAIPSVLIMALFLLGLSVYTMALMNFYVKFLYIRKSCVYSIHCHKRFCVSLQKCNM